MVDKSNKSVICHTLFHRSVKCIFTEQSSPAQFRTVSSCVSSRDGSDYSFVRIQYSQILSLIQHFISDFFLLCESVHSFLSNTSFLKRTSVLHGLMFQRVVVVPALFEITTTRHVTLLQSCSVKARVCSFNSTLPSTVVLPPPRLYSQPIHCLCAFSCH